MSHWLLVPIPAFSYLISALYPADYFKELLVESKKEFHAMFKRTYGAIYEQNSYVFSDLFVELEMYYTWGQVNLSKVLDEFFNKLYQKMFTVLNSQFSYDDK